MMTEHKPLPVADYKPQFQADIDLANEGKALEERVLRWLEKVDSAFIDPRLGLESDDRANRNEQGRFLALGKTNIQQGFMWSIRSIFLPTRIKLPEDTI